MSDPSPFRRSRSAAPDGGNLLALRDGALTRRGGRRKIGSGSVGHVYAGTYESHPVAIKKHKMDGSMMDAKALVEFEFEVRG